MGCKREALVGSSLLKKILNVYVIFLMITLFPMFVKIVSADPSNDWFIKEFYDTRDSGEYTSIALDSDGYPHISYYDVTNTNLKYAYETETGWTTEPVDSPWDVGQYTSIALDSDGYPHISYYDVTNADLKYAKKIGTSSWTTITVDSTGNVGQYTSIALDQNGYPHISYYDYTNGDLKYAYETETGWTKITVDSPWNVGQYTSIALDSSNNPHISYYNVTSGHLKYATKLITGWITSTVDPDGQAGQYSSIAIDAGGYPHISYYDNNNNCLKYARRLESRWQIENVDYGNGIVGSHCSIALDKNDKPHISYYDVDQQGLKYAKKIGTSWDRNIVDSNDNVNVGQYTSIALDSDGYPHISYYDVTHEDLKYAKQLPNPNIPTFPYPGNDATGVDINTVLSWTGGDPDPGDTVTYDVYFGKTNPPPQVVWNQSGVSYYPGTMDYDTTYYWKIVAWDTNGDSSSGPIWSFTTEPGNNPPPTEGLIAYWKFDESSDDTAYDSSGNHYNGELIGWGADYPIRTTGVAGNALEIKKSYTSSSKVKIDYAVDEHIENALTIMAWVKWYGTSSVYGDYIFDNRGPDNCEGFVFYIDATGKLNFVIGVTDSSNQKLNQEIASTTCVPINSWIQVAVVFDSVNNKMIVFINGEQNNLIDISPLTFNHNTEFSAIGNARWQGPNQFDGILDEIRVYNKALTEDEINDTAGIVFSDNFNDNRKDTNKWTEKYHVDHDGFWDETNHSAEFQLNESGGSGQRFEGISSSSFPVSLTDNNFTIITCDWMTKVENYPYNSQTAGAIHFRVQEENTENWIEIVYFRQLNFLNYTDSTYQNSWNTLKNNQDDGTWNNEILINSTGYEVISNSYESGFVNYNVFSSTNPTLTVQIYIELGGSEEHSAYWWRASFDNVSVLNGQASANQPTILIQYSDPRCCYKDEDQVTIYANFSSPPNICPTSFWINISTMGDNHVDNAVMTSDNDICSFSYNWLIPPGSDEDGPFTVSIYESSTGTSALSIDSSKQIDNTNPTIESWNITTLDSATIFWNAGNELNGVNGTVEYGLTSSYNLTKSTSSYATRGDITLSKLSTDITYHYRIICYDIAGNGNYTSDQTFYTGYSNVNQDSNKSVIADAGGPYNGTVNENITFDGSNSTSPNGRIWYQWDFGDGNLTRSSDSPKTIHSYSYVGNYTVELLVDDILSNSSKTTYAVIIANYTEEVSNLTENSSTKINISNEDSIIIRVEITPTKELTNVVLTITDHGNDIPSNIAVKPKKEDLPEPSGKTIENISIFRYVDITIKTNDTYVAENDIKSTYIIFKVNQDWIQNNEIDNSTITLMRYHGDKWENLNTENITILENENYSYYISTSQGFSTFAVVGSKVVGPEDNPKPELEIPWLFIIGFIIAGLAALIFVLFKAKLIYISVEEETQDKEQKTITEQSSPTQVLRYSLYSWELSQSN